MHLDTPGEHLVAPGGFWRFLWEFLWEVTKTDSGRDSRGDSRSPGGAAGVTRGDSDGDSDGDSVPRRPPGEQQLLLGEHQHRPRRLRVVRGARALLGDHLRLLRQVGGACIKGGVV